jgi:predicted HTH domain antitoxin
MAAITVEVPDEIAENFGTADEISRDLYENFIVAQRQQGNISLGKAAELLGITYADFFDLLGRKGLSFINAAPEEIEDSYRDFEKIMEHACK